MTNRGLKAGWRSMDINRIFGENNVKEYVADTVKALCASCDVASECLSEAIGNRETMGIRAGTTYQERRRERTARGMNIRQPTGHGTYAGYRAHQKVKSIPCEPCQIAGGKYLREWRLQRSGFGKA